MDSPIEVADVFFRFAAIGQLVLLAVTLTRQRPLTLRSGLLLLLCPCTAAYLLLTAPIDELYGDFRGLLMVLTHAIPYLVWVLSFDIFEERFRPRNWPFLAKILVGLFALWHIYFFGYLEGRGLFHDLSHYSGIRIIPPTGQQGMCLPVDRATGYASMTE